MTASRAQTRANYDRLSRWYDLLAGSSERKHRDIALHQLAVQEGERVLEIGPGTGRALAVLGHTVGPTGAAWGLDLSPGMCRAAQRHIATATPSLRLAAVVCGDAIALPFPSNTLDALFMSFTLELFTADDMVRVLQECRRVLREGGRLGVAALSECGRPNLVERAYGWAHRRFPAWIDCRPIPVSEVLAENGFQVGGVIRGSMWGLHVEIAVARKNPLGGISGNRGVLSGDITR
jgi:ubiquinone/menaquinone biosynthesis C-methylase UbiE